ncbi:T9SS type A sorting domain-containing protein [Labilibacter sediminis]|nr:T9SS type A sorting domain-containing protein [Labilibacter sediminis]
MFYFGITYLIFTTMKKTFTLLIAFVVSLSLTAKKTNPFGQRAKNNIKTEKPVLKSAQEAYMPSSIDFDNWDGAAWQFSGTTHYQYDVNGNITLATSPYDRKTYTYDENSNLTQVITENYDGGLEQYVNVSKEDYKYNEQNEQYEYTYSTWSGSDWVTLSGNSNILLYDSHGNQTEELYSSYQFGVGWVEESGRKTDYTYVGNLITVEIEYEREGGVWVPKIKFEWFYNESNILTHAFEYAHDGNDFVLAGRYTDVSWYVWDPVGTVETSYPNHYTYQTYNGSGDINDGANYTNDEKMEGSYPDGNGGGTPPTTIETYSVWDTDWVYDSRSTWKQMTNLVSYFDEIWNGSSWLPTYFDENYTTAMLNYNISHTYVAGVLTSADKYSVSFDSFGNRTEEKTENHTGDENWITNWGSLYNITYEGGTSKKLLRITQNWDNDSKIYVNNQRETFNYTPTSVEDKSSSVLRVYPTVFNQHITVETESSGYMLIYNLTGSIVLQQTLHSGVNTVSTAVLPEGYYLISVNDETFKVVKQ